MTWKIEFIGLRRKTRHSNGPYQLVKHSSGMVKKEYSRSWLSIPKPYSTLNLTTCTSTSWPLTICYNQFWNQSILMISYVLNLNATSKLHAIKSTRKALRWYSPLEMSLLSSFLLKLNWKTIWSMEIDSGVCLTMTASCPFSLRTLAAMWMYSTCGSLETCSWIDT